MKTIAIIPIGGVGSRMNSDIPKQYIEVNDKPIFIYTVEKFQANPNIDNIVISCKKEFFDDVKNECEKYHINKLYKIVCSGETQLETIFNSVNAIKKDFSMNDKIVIHVGNRPNITDRLITDCVNLYDKYGSLTTTVPCIEGMVNINNNSILSRKDLIRIQTPQVYSFSDIEKYCNNSDEYCNKGSTICDLFLLEGRKIKFVNGEMLNFKITYEEDLELFKLIVNSKNS